jgi:RHS repeat-associated protein
MKAGTGVRWLWALVGACALGALNAAHAQSGNWVKIADEGESFTVGGTQTVRYGTGTSWVQLNISGTSDCSNSAFGSDPAVYYVKECDVLVPASGAPVVSLSSGTNPSQLSQSVSLTVSVSPATASGQVQFRDGSRTLGTATLSAGSASLSTSFVLSGAHSLSAVYLGDANNAPATSAALSQGVNGPSGGNWTKIADEFGSFSISGTQVVRFGTGTSWVYLSTSASGSCGSDLFGSDPAEGYAKECDVLVVQGSLPPPPLSPAPVVSYEYDAQGNATKTVQAPGVTGFNFATNSSYDALSRRKDTTDARSGLTQFGYDGGDRTTSITDPRSLVTQYPRNGLGDVTSLVSPDTGTASHTYDAVGNLKTRTDSRGVLATYSYDELNRLSGIVYSQSGQASQTYSWNYDQTGAGFSNGIGRLTSTAFPSGTAQYAYDPQGRLLSETQTLSAQSGANSSAVTTVVAYGYDAAGHVTSITYPSGRKLSLSYTAGQLTAIGLAKDATSTATTLLDQIAYAPFDGPLSWNWQTASGAQAHQRVYDTSGRLVRYRLGNTIRDVTYDAADRIVSYTHYDATSAAALPSLDQSFGYDELGRLTSVTAGTSSWSIGYDANGNRTGVTLNGTASTYTTSATSNRLTSTTNPARSFGYDNAGNTTGDGSYTAGYALGGTLASLTRGGVTATFDYDGNSRRVRKFNSTGSGSTVIFVYDQAGQLLGEYDSAGNAVREYVWLGATPVAVFMPDPASSANPPPVYYIHADHLDTPRVVLDPSNNVRWRWLAEPFGTTAPEDNPASLGAFAFSLRFPGQYADAETGLAYNYFRHYDPSIGRYAQSDPIGLVGGINTYAYVQGNALSYIDPNGLFLFPPPLILIPAVVTAPAWAVPVAVGTAVVAVGSAIYLTLSPNDPPQAAAGPAPTPNPSKPALPDVCPDDLCEQLALAEAKAGAGVPIMGQMADEPRLVAHYGPGPWVKMEHKHVCPDGRVLVIHYFSNRRGLNVELKFKRR